jgi:hypothetical protein
MARFLGRKDEGAEPPPSADDTIVASPAAAQIPSPSQLKRELKALVDRREIDIRDLGGLVLEMVRRGRFREELLVERAEDVLAGEERIRELDMLLNPPPGPRGPGGGPVCRCGTALEASARFCWRCGRPNEYAMPLAPCRRCNRALPADAEFCPNCGLPTAIGPAGAADETLVRPPGPDR